MIHTNLKILSNNSIKSAESYKIKNIFCDEILDFLDSLSKSLMKHKEYSDLVSLGFWCRRANMLKESRNYDKSRRGRGIVLHLAPQNIPLNFAYSLISGLISGNANIVRIPFREYTQVNIFVNEVNTLLQQYKNLKDSIVFVRFQSKDEIFEELSKMADIRMIWGGDESINKIRQIKINPLAYDLVFGDRYSLALINSDSFLDSNNKQMIINNFYNDTYLFDQNACTSPKIIIWLGSIYKNNKAKELFYSMLLEKMQEYKIADSKIMDKYLHFCKGAISLNIKAEIFTPKLIVIQTNTDNIESLAYNSGFFIDRTIHTLQELSTILQKKAQSLIYYGLNKEQIQAIINLDKKGLDRIVPFGKSLEFSFHWDGYDLITSLSKKIEVI